MGNLNKVVYTDHQTVITADNLNAIQDSVIQNTSYTTCSTAAGTAAKTASLTNFVLTTGSCVRVKFTNTNTAANPTLNINSTGAKALKKYGTDEYGATEATSWKEGAVLSFIYDGTNWVQLDYPTKLDSLGIGSTKYNVWDNTVSVLNVGAAYSGGNFRIYGTTEDYPPDLPGTINPSLTSTSVVAYRQSFMQTSSSIAHAIVVLYEIYPVSGRIWINAYNTTWRGWRAVAFTDNTVPSTGGKFTGSIRVDNANGTTSAVGESYVMIGNATASGTAGNCKGFVRLYSSGEGFTQISAATSNGSYNVTAPAANGTIALTNNPTNITVDRSDGTTSAQGYSSLILGNNKTTGTAGNSAGDLQIYGRTAYKTEFISPPNSPTANRVITIPDASGTIALNLSESFVGTAMTGGTLNRCTGTISERPSIYTNGREYYLYGRLVITSFVRTNSNPFITFQTSFRPLHTLYGDTGIRFEADVAKPEKVAINLTTEGVLSIQNTETFFNMPTNSARVIWLFTMLALV